MRTRLFDLSIKLLPLLLLATELVGCSKTESGVALGTLERDRVAHTATVNEVITELFR